MDKTLTVAEPSVGTMLQSMLANIQQGGTTPQTVEVLKGMMDLYERSQDKQAQREFNKAFTRLQQSIPTVRPDKAVNDGKGNAMYQYCSYEEIHGQAQPLLTQHGFSVRFSQKLNDNGSVTVTCHLMHESGHTESNEYTVRAGRGAPGMNETKIDASASTVAQREAFCDALNIIRRGRDDDAKLQGSSLEERKWKELKQRALDVNADESAFLKFAGAANFEGIPAEAYDRCDKMLFKKEVQLGLRDLAGNWIEK